MAMTSAPSTHRPGPLPGALVLLAALSLATACGTDSAAAVEDPRGLVILPPDPATQVALPDDVRPRDNFHYFGPISDGDTVEHVFRMRNVEQVPIAITNVSPGCGCLVPRISYTDANGELVRALSNRSSEDKLLEIPPGIEVDLVVRVDTTRISGKNIHKTITTRLTTDFEHSRFMIFEVSVLPSAPFQLNPSTLKFGNIPLSAGAEMKLDIVPVGESGMRIAGLRTIPEGLEAELELSSIMGQEVWELTSRWIPPLAPGPHEAKIVVETVDPAGEPGRPLEVSARCTAVADVQASSRLVLVLRGVPTDPAAAEVEIYSLLAGHRLRIVAADVEEAHAQDLQLQFEPRSPDAEGRGERWFLRLMPRRTLSAGVLAGTATVILDDPQTSEIKVSYAVHVE